MAKVKFSKTELKSQRDKLKQFARFLPTLELKRQQLQMEVMHLTEAILKHKKRVQEFREGLDPWMGLFAVPEALEVFDQVEVDDLVMETRNIAGVDIQVFEEVRFSPLEHDLFSTSPWIDAGIEALQELIRLEIQTRALAAQKSLLENELRTTTQRVNLFEKVKIPEAKENIRKIQIFLGDQQTAAVGRSKIAKRKLVHHEAQEA